MTDRSQAISLVEAALQAGRIVQADRDMRIDQINNAASQQELELVVRDLQPQATATAAAAAPTVTAGAPAPATGQQPWPLVNYGPSQGQPVDLTAVSATAAGAGKAIGGIVALVVLLAVLVPIVGVVIALASSQDTIDDLSFGEPVDETTYLPGQEPGDNVHTAAGFDALVSAVQAESGSTQVFDATIYPRYAVVYLPEDATGKRYQYYYWDGEVLEANDSKSTSDSPRIDLATVDGALMVRLLEDVRSRIEDPTTWYVILGTATTGDPQMSFHASNEYGEGAYFSTTLDGQITYESTYE